MNYTVLLLYPDYLNESHTPVQTYLAHVSAGNVTRAIQLAKEDLFESSGYTIDDENPDDFFVLAVFETHLDDLKDEAQ